MIITNYFEYVEVKLVYKWEVKLLMLSLENCTLKNLITIKRFSLSYIFLSIWFTFNPIEKSPLFFGDFYSSSSFKMWFGPWVVEASTNYMLQCSHVFLNDSPFFTS